MHSILLLFIHFLSTLVKRLRPSGIRIIMAENLAHKQQLIILKRQKKRCPKLSTFDRFFYGLIPFFTGKYHVHKFAIILKPATILSFHKALVQRKYKKLFSNKSHNKLGRKPPDQKIIDLVIKMKKRNPTFAMGVLPCKYLRLLALKLVDLLSVEYCVKIEINSHQVTGFRC